MKAIRSGSIIDWTGWAGETPYFLVINEGPTNGPVSDSWAIDLDEPGWTDSPLMRVEGEWVLVAKQAVDSVAGTPVLAMRVLPGEQPYYHKRHVGIAYGPGSGEVEFYGIGKKRLDGHVDRLWIMPNGIIVPGDDGDIIATRMLKQSGEGPANS